MDFALLCVLSKLACSCIIVVWLYGMLGWRDEILNLCLPVNSGSSADLISSSIYKGLIKKNFVNTTPNGIGTIKNCSKFLFNIELVNNLCFIENLYNAW